MNQEIQFTRYLYEKDEVKLALILSILNKKEERAEFWAYELYYSGFEQEIICFGSYFKQSTMQKDFLKSEKGF